MNKLIYCFTYLFLLTHLTACADKDTVCITWSGDEAVVEGEMGDSIDVKINGGKVCINNNYRFRDLKFVLRGNAESGSLIYKGKHKTTFELDGLVMNSTDSIPLNFKNGKKNIIVLKNENTITVSADTLDGALIRTKGKLQIDGTGSLSLRSAAVGCKGIKVGEDLVMNSGNVTIETSGNYLEVDTTAMQMPPFGDFPEGDFPGPPQGFLKVWTWTV